MAKEYYTVATFRASSGNRWWRVNRDEDGNLSCTCPGWCQRVATDGSRSCKHVRKVREGGVQGGFDSGVRVSGTRSNSKLPRTPPSRTFRTCLQLRLPSVATRRHQPGQVQLREPESSLQTLHHRFPEEARNVATV